MGEPETAQEMVEALEAGRVSAVELVERALRRAEAWQPRINAFSQLWPDRALEEARRIDRAGPSRRGPLAGVPVAVKDLFDVAGRETTGCCAAYRGTVAGADAPVVAAVRAAGAVVVGKTNQHELAAGGTNLVSACGPTGNPWDPDRITGGSSGGSAAAVAAGVVPLALGSDTGGSVRIPASLCGTFGLKPTTGRLPLEGMMPLSPSMDCPGPLAATVADLRRLHSCYAPLAEGGGTARARVGVLEGFFEEVVAAEVAAAVETVASVLERAGAEVVRRDGRGIEDARTIWMRVCTPEFARSHPALADPGRRAMVAPEVREWIEMGERLTEEEVREARRRREEVGRWFRERLDGLDALLIPTTPYPAPRRDQGEVELGGGRRAPVREVGPGFLTCSVSLAGLPALNLPAARSAEGLPIGVSLVGRDDGEGRILELAATWERAVGYRPRWPEP